MKILYVSSELSPLVTTGGLGDIAFSLPRALREQGHDIRVAIPCYRAIPDDVHGEPCCECVADLGGKRVDGRIRMSHIPTTDVPLYLVQNDDYFDREGLYGASGAYEYDDNAERFCFFCLALLHGIGQTGWRPDVVHCHDWHTAAIPAYIKTRLSGTAAWRGMPTLFTIHNLAFQGRYKSHFLPSSGLSPALFTPDALEFHGDINLMKAGIAFASKLNTVSPTYAKEIQTPEYGQGLDGFLRTRTSSLSGILNGADYSIWHPAVDCNIAQAYSKSDLAGKAICRTYLLNFLGLPECGVPLIAMISRLYWQKGVDLVIDALDELMKLDIQLAVLGTGDPYFEQALDAAALKYPSKLRVIFAFDHFLSHQLEAGADFFLMPSHFEPCGLSQMYSLAYGTIPIVRKTGGLADTVRPITKANVRNGKATGIVFKDATPQALTKAVKDAVALYNAPDAYRAVQMAGMNEDFSWAKSCKAYVKLYQQALAQP